MARPARNKKSVDYSQFLDLEDYDEDFAASPPVSKKARVETKNEKKEKAIRKTLNEETTPTDSQRRLPLDDKLYQRDLEVALALSVKETSVLENDENVPRNGLEEITDGEEALVKGRGRRQAAAKAITEQRKLLTEESGDDEEADEFHPDTMADSDSESETGSSGEDEEFEVKKAKRPSVSKVVKQKPKNGIKEENVPKAQKAAAAPPTPVSIKIKQMPEKKAPVTTSVACKPASPISPPVGTKRPAWTPPASSGAARSPLAGVTVKSPNQGLRLGLSRFTRVKPLHPTAALH